MHVLGAGALGCLWSARLAIAGAKPTLLLRPRSPKADLCVCGKAQLQLEEAAIVADNARTSAIIRKVDVHAEVIGHAQGNSEGFADIHTVLIATKAPATLAALESVGMRLAPGAILVLLSNGALAISEGIRKSSILSHTQVLLGTTTHGALVRSHFHVVHAGVGRTWFGRAVESTLMDSGYVGALSELSRAGLGASDVGIGILRHLWLKLAANCVINPLTSLWGVTNGVVLQKQEGLAILKSVCAEINAVATALHPEWPKDGVVPPSVAELQSFVHAVTLETAGNQSSMLQDLLAHRTTEIDFLSGWVALKGVELGIDVPVNAELARRVTEKQQSIGVHNMPELEL